MAEQTKQPLLKVGWREWIALPEFGIPYLKTKIDTGARTSALHAFNLKPTMRKGRDRIEFGIHPLQGNDEIEVACVADIVDYRRVMDSGGHAEMRYVIRTPIVLGRRTWSIEITLTNRDSMRFRMLLGRTGLAQRLLISPTRSYLTGKAPPRSRLKKLYQR